MRKGLLACALGFAQFTLRGARVDAETLTPEMCKAKVEENAKILEKKGPAAIADIKQIRFADGAGYLWIHDLNNKMVVHPLKPAMDGTDVAVAQDPNGLRLFVAMNEIVEEKGAGWVAYMWPKPNETTPLIEGLLRPAGAEGKGELRARRGCV